MCGRYLILPDEFDEIECIVGEVSQRYSKADSAIGEIFPTNNIPVIYSHKGKKVLSIAKWGFPGFKGKGVIINARAETVSEKPMFRKSFEMRRCIVPANGYYEWQTHEDKTKTKYLIRVKEKNSFFMAGLYNFFADENQELSPTFKELSLTKEQFPSKELSPVSPTVAIITTVAGRDISFIHNRMPVIIRDEFIDVWLDKNSDPAVLKGMLTPFDEGELSFEIA